MSRERHQVSGHFRKANSLDPFWVTQGTWGRVNKGQDLEAKKVNNFNKLESNGKWPTAKIDSPSKGGYFQNEWLDGHHLLTLQLT